MFNRKERFELRGSFTVIVSQDYDTRVVCYLFTSFNFSGNSLFRSMQNSNQSREYIAELIGDRENSKLLYIWWLVVVLFLSLFLVLFTYR